MQTQVSSPLVEKFAGIVGAAHVRVSDPGDDLSEFGRGHGHTPASAPAIVVSPGTPEEVAAALAVATQQRTAVVTRGAGFSVSGFAFSDADHVTVIETRRLDRVLAVDAENLTVTAQAGVLNSELTRIVAEAGLRVQTVAVPVRRTTLGGALSGVVGGGVPARSSVTGGNVQSVAGLVVALPTGALLRTGAGRVERPRCSRHLPGARRPEPDGCLLGGRWHPRRQGRGDAVPRTAAARHRRCGLGLSR